MIEINLLPEELKKKTIEVAKIYLAGGIDIIGISMYYVVMAKFYK